MQAIRTVYHGPTDHRPSRITATCAAGSVTIPYSYDTDDVGVHRLAAVALIRKLKWHGTFTSGGLKDGSCVFCFITEHDTFTI